MATKKKNRWSLRATTGSHNKASLRHDNKLSLKHTMRKRRLLEIGTILVYLAGDYAQDGVIDGSLLQTLAPYAQTLIL